MTDIEKVIKQISAEIKLAEYVNKDYQTVDLSLLKDVLELLKEQQSVIECLKGKIKRYEFEKGWDECPDRMNGGGL